MRFADPVVIDAAPVIDDVALRAEMPDTLAPAETMFTGGAGSAAEVVVCDRPRCK